MRPSPTAVLLALLALPAQVADTATTLERPAPLPWDGSLDYRLEILGYGQEIRPADSDVNPGNALLNLPRFQAHLELRPDFELTWPRLRLRLKPRADLFYREWDSGHAAGQDDVDADVYFNEATVRLAIGDQLFVSYGRGNLQWGPSFLLSPSNPFQHGNGRDNPIPEVPGMDYARAVWVPDPAWSLSLIASLDEGRQEFLERLERFERGAAVKADYTGDGWYASLIASVREGSADAVTVGGYAGRNLGEAVLVYAEGNLPPRAAESQALVGASYTFPWLAILSAEYYYSGRGTTAEGLFRAFPVFDGNALPSDLLFRRNYFFLQYYDEINNRLEVTVRWTLGLDDGSSRVAAFVTYAISDRIEGFALAAVEEGGSNSEFDSFIEYAWAVGLSLSY